MSARVDFPGEKARVREAVLERARRFHSDFVAADKAANLPHQLPSNFADCPEDYQTDVVEAAAADLQYEARYHAPLISPKTPHREPRPQDVSSGSGSTSQNPPAPSASAGAGNLQRKNA